MFMFPKRFMLGSLQACWMRSGAFTAIPEQAEEGGYVVKRLELPVATQGESEREALKNLKEAIEGYLEVRAEILGESKAQRAVVEVTIRKAPRPLLA